MFKFLLFPFAAFWAVFMRFRRNFYNNGRRTIYKKPAICVGNLCMGGSGKTPHVGYLVDLLKENNFNVAILSRGYKRKTKGFRLANSTSTSKDVGDEPLLFYKKHEDIPIAVCENRIKGMDKIMEKFPETNVFLLDDAYQYMPLRPGLSILLSDYYKNYINDFVVPVGRLREGKSAAKDADIIIITKSPKTVPTMEEQMILNKIRPQPYQKVYFSYIEFGELTAFTQMAKNLSVDSLRSAVAVCGIANPYPFLEYINSSFWEKQQLVFSDHHCFTKEDIQKIHKYFDRSMQKNCAVITTEKDAMRLLDSEFKEEIEALPIFYIPIEVKFHRKYKEEFEEQILEYVSKNTKNS
jgi:tetraacyldisaccharide 4'-kinase